ncbi:MAG: alpha/beta hydrolase [Pseudohongiellaceae bacterium]|nr:alpha/beta hydrolase [Pseudohongiellaceae bacterium]
MIKLKLIGLLALIGLVPTLSYAQVKITSDIVYGHKDGMALFYDMFEPEQNKNGAAIIYMVSGGWFSRWVEPQTRAERFSDFIEAGYTVFAVHHGSAPRYTVPEAYADVSRAVRHIKLNASNYGVDADRLGVTGGSAGGHLSLMLGLNSDGGDPTAEDPVLKTDNEIAVVVAYFPPVDLRAWTGPSERFPALDFPNELAAGISPLLLVDQQEPPVLLIHGDADTLVPISHSQRIYAELQTKGVESEFITIEGGGHGFRAEDAVRAGANRIQWFNKHLLN